MKCGFFDMENVAYMQSRKRFLPGIQTSLFALSMEGFGWPCVVVPDNWALYHHFL